MEHTFHLTNIHSALSGSLQDPKFLQTVTAHAHLFTRHDTSSLRLSRDQTSSNPSLCIHVISTVLHAYTSITWTPIKQPSDHLPGALQCHTHTPASLRRLQSSNPHPMPQPPAFRRLPPVNERVEPSANCKTPIKPPPSPASIGSSCYLS